MSKRDAVLRTPDLGEIAAAPAALARQAAAARTALGEMRQRARDLSLGARRRAGGEIARRRTAAAATLENLAATLRPQDKPRIRRRAVAVAGGSTLALVAALAAGVAIGMYLAQRASAKKPSPTEAKADADASAGPQPAGVRPPEAKPASPPAG